ncbi:MAG TPA: GNAT family N-acetyltransferase [Planctomycetota bacterium]|nr:GNAT family N-acetyltransferase [Planctomycetota bacterium]
MARRPPLPAYGPLRDQAERDRYADIISECFGMTVAEGRVWLARTEPDRLRGWRDGRGRLLGGLNLLALGQWFGGRCVPMGGISAVGVPPEARGRGVARALMDAAVAELAASGVPLSTLYPASTALYRRSGYELAGSRFEVSIDLPRLRVHTPELRLRAATPADDAAIEEVAARHASLRNGQARRDPYLWGRVRSPRAGSARGFVVEERGRLTGHVFVEQKALVRGHYDLNLTDVCALTPAAARAILSFLAGHATMADHALWAGSPGDVLLALLPERHYTLRLLDPWMTRIVDVRAALESRGWPAGMRADLRLAVSDELIPANRGTFRLQVSGGEAKVTRVPGAPAAALSMHVRGLAPLYTGHMSPRELELAGLLAGPEPALEIAAALFAAPAPTMLDMF